MRYDVLFLISKTKGRQNGGPTAGKFKYNYAYGFDLNKTHAKWLGFL